MFEFELRAGEQRVFQVASKGLIDWRLDRRIAHPMNPDRLFSGEVRCRQS